MSGGYAPGGLIRRIGPASLAYLPHAFEDERSLRFAEEALRSAAGSVPADTVLLRWDCPWQSADFDDAVARAAGLRPSPMRIQPPDTVILDLRGTEEELLAAMKSKTRYNVGLASRRNVEVRVVGSGDDDAEEALTAWYRLYRDTARRDRIAIHSLEYYRRVFLGTGTAAPGPEDLARSDPWRELLLASHEEDLLGGIVTLSYGGTTTYLYGAGADIKRNHMASYLLQWEAIRRARDRGDRWYDLFGIPPEDDPNHPMHGLYRFKTGFGGTVVHRAGAWDVPLRPLAAQLYRAAEGLRKWYYFSFRKRGA